MQILTKTRSFLIILTVLSLSSCYQEEFIDDSTTVTPEPEIEIEVTGVVGNATDENGQAIQDFEIVVNNTSLPTENTNFYHELFNTNKKGQFLFLKKDNEIIGLTNAYLIENDVNFVEMVSFPQRQQTGLSTQLEIHKDITIETSDVQFIDAAGTTYNQNSLVNHFASSDESILSNLGTNARGIQNELFVVKPSVAFFFEIVNQQGASLDFTNSTSFTLSNSLSLGEGLFFLNEERDEWILLKDNDLNKSGFYMMASYEEGVYLEGEIIKEGAPVSFMPFNWTNENFEYAGLSTSLGRWGTVVSELTVMNYELTSPCGDELQREIIESSATAQEDITIVINDDVENLVKVETKIFDCSGEVQTIPALTMTTDVESTSPGNKELIYLFNDADVDTWIPVCSADFQIGGYNILDNQNGPLINWSVNQNNEIEYLSNCEDFEDGYSYIRIKDDMRVYQPFTVDIVQGNLTEVKEESEKISLVFGGDVVGAYGETEVKIKIDDPEFVSNSHGYFVECTQSGCGINEFNVTHFEETTNGWLRVSFSGTIWMLKTGPQDVVGDFEVEGVILCKL